MLSLRARHPRAVATELHDRVTVLAGLSSEDREALRSTFASITEPAAPGLEALVEVDGTTVPLDESFAATFELLGAAPCVVDVPAAAGSAVGAFAAEASPSAVSHGNEASLARLHRRRDALSAELNVARRALDEERALLASRSMGDRGPSRAPSGHSNAGVRELVDQLAAALEAPVPTDPLELADRLDSLSRRSSATAARDAALGQLMAECRVAIDSVQAVLTGQVGGSDDRLAVLAELDRVRDEMVDAARGTLTRRARRRLADLQHRESELLAATGHRSYRDLSADVRSGRAPGGDDMQLAQARLELLHELEAFWSERRELASADRAEEAELIGQAAELLGEPPGVVLSPRLAAVKLRARISRPAGTRSTVRVIAGRLATELGYDSAEDLTPRELLEIAEAELEVADSTGSERPGPTSSPGGSRLDELEATEQRLRGELDHLAVRLDALGRAESVPGVEPQAAPAGDWSLAAELEALGSPPKVGSLPALIIEPQGIENALGGVDVPSVVALASRRQLIWVTDRPEVVEGVEMLGSMGSTIIV